MATLQLLEQGLVLLTQGRRRQPFEGGGACKEQNPESHHA